MDENIVENAVIVDTSKAMAMTTEAVVVGVGNGDFGTNTIRVEYPQGSNRVMVDHSTLYVTAEVAQQAARHLYRKVRIIIEPVEE